MVRNTLKLTKVSSLAVATFAMLAPIQTYSNVSAVAKECTTNVDTGVITCTEERNFQISVQEILDVTITPPDDWATSSSSTTGCLTNKVGLSVSSNNVQGFLATMTATTNETALIHNDDNTHRIETSSITSFSNPNLAKGIWGWSRTATDNSTIPTQYNPILPVTTNEPSPVLANGTYGSKDQDIYFAACAGKDTISGTYSQSVLISVVSGVHDDPFDGGTNGGGQNGTNGGNQQQGTIAGTQGGTSGSSSFSSGSISSDTSSDKTTNKDKDTSNSSRYDGFAYPQGQTNTVSTINEGTPLATGLAITACIAAIFGIFFFILLFKRRKDEDEEEQQY